MGLFDSAKDKVSELADQSKDKIDVDQVGDTIDDKTGGKFADQVDQGQDFAKDKLGE